MPSAVFVSFVKPPTTMLPSLEKLLNDQTASTNVLLPKNSVAERQDEPAGTRLVLAAVAGNVQAAFVQQAPSATANNTGLVGSIKPKGKENPATMVTNAQLPAPKRARPLAKPAAPKAKKYRGNLGRLECFKEMPLDIFSEICSQLGLDDLLHLARVDRNFRRVLMAKKNRHLWTSARKNSGLPPLTATDFSDPAWASLLYDLTCVDCDRNRASFVDYYIRKRWCKDCKTDDFHNAATIRATFKDKGDYLYDHALHCTPCSPGKFPLSATSIWTMEATITNHYSWNDVLCTNAALARQFPECESDCEEDECVDGCETHTKKAAAYSKIVKRWAKDAAAARVDGAAHVAWAKEAEKSKLLSKEEAIDKRQHDIEARLIGLGYDKRDFWYGPDTHKLVFQTRPLTDRIWSRISGDIISDVEFRLYKRKRAEAHERRDSRQSDVYKRRQGLIDGQATSFDKAVFPSHGAFLEYPSIRPHWASDEDELDQVDPDDWAASLPEITATIKENQYLNKVHKFHEFLKQLQEAGIPIVGLEELIKRSNVPDDRYGSARKVDMTDMTHEEMDPIFALYLTRSVCRFAGCCSTFSFADAWEHKDQHGGYFGKEEHSCGTSLEWMALAGKLVEETGLDSTTVTEEELQELGAVFECRECKVAVKCGSVLPIKVGDLTWMELLRHASQYHDDMFRSPSVRYSAYVRPDLRVIVAE